MESFNSAHAFGLSLVDQGHFAAEEIQENCEEMTLVKNELMESCDEKEIELSQSYELQVWFKFREFLLSKLLFLAQSFQHSSLFVGFVRLIRQYLKKICD